jgi:hypothetical protein
VPGVRAADHPQQLVRQVAVRVFPARQDAAPGPDDRRIGERPAQLGQPVRLGDRVVVDERDQVAGGRRDAGVARLGHPGALAREQGHLPRQQIQQTLLQRGVAVDHDQYLARSELVGREAPYALQQQADPTLGMRADDHGDRR